MKSINLALFLLILLTALSCKKDNPATIHPFSLPGTWRLFSEVGGIGGIHETFPTSQGHLTYIFRADSTCTRISNTDTVNTTFSIRLDSSACHVLYQYLYLGSTATGPSGSTIGNAHDTLWIANDCTFSDGMAYGFVKDY